MAVPDYQTLMRPVIALTEDGFAWRASAIRDAIVREFELTPEDVEERLPSGRDTTLRNRVGWALTYLYRAGLLDRPSRSVYQLNERGRKVLAQHPDRIDNTVLEQFDEFRAFRSVQDVPGAEGGSVIYTTPTCPEAKRLQLPERCPRTGAAGSGAPSETRPGAKITQLSDAATRSRSRRITEMATTKPPTDRALARAATARLNAQGVTGPAAAAWLQLYQSRNPTLDWLQNQTWCQLERYALQLDRIDREDRASIKWHYEEATGRPWLKGIIATYLAAMVRAHHGEDAARRAHDCSRLAR